MLDDSKLGSLSNHLNTVTEEHENHHNALQDLFKQVESLLTEYNSLKSDYEEVKDGRDKYKKQARGQV
jgi:archaellum component FlaC